MRRSIVLVVSLAAGTGTAAADPFELRENTLREPEAVIEAADVHVDWRADAVAASAGSGTRADHTGEASASVSAEVAVTSADCDFAVAGGQIDARSGDAAPLSFQQWASVCPLSGVMRIQLDHRLLWDVTPRLLAPPRLRPTGNRRETIGVEMAMYADEPVPRVPGTGRQYAELGASRFEVGIGWVDDSVPGTFPEMSVSGAVDFYHLVRERADGGVPLHVRLMSSEIAAVAPSDPPPMAGVPASTFTAIMRLDAFRFEGARWGGLRVGAGLGLASAMISYDSPHGSRVRDVLAGRGGVSVERELGPLTARVAGGRELWPLWDGRAVIDDRATASLAAGSGATRGRVEVSAARIHLLDTDGVLTASGAGGVTASAERDLGPHLTARAHLELGRSVYAAGASFDTPRWAADGLVSLQLHAGDR